MKFIVSVIIAILSPVIFAHEVDEINVKFNQLSDLSREKSIDALKGKSFLCDEFFKYAGQKSFTKFKTKLGFVNKPNNYFGNETILNHLSYSEFRRVSEELFAQVPQFGCVGIEWGVAYLKEAPYLHMSTEYGHVGNSNLGPCYNLHFRVQGSKLLAIGKYDSQIIHALDCSPR